MQFQPDRPPKGPISHLKYSWHAARRRRAIARAIESLDERLRAAVGLRDERLAALGEATLAQHAGGARARAFAETLDRLDSDNTAAEAAWDATRVELASTEIEQHETQARLERDLAELQAQLKPLRRALDADRRALADLEKAAEAADEQEAQQARQLTRAADRLKTTTDDEVRAELVAQQQALEASLSDLRAAAAPRAEQLAAQAAPLQDQEAVIDELEALQARTEEDGASAVAAAKARVTLNTDELKQAKGRMERLVARRRAVLMDLGHEVLHAFPEGRTPAQESARGALERIDGLRAERRELDAQRMGIDWVPVERTLKVLGVSVVVLLGLWIWL